MNVKEALEVIRIQDAEIKAKEEDVNQLKSQRCGYWTSLQKAIESGDTTGDPIRDLIVRVKRDFDADMEARYRKFEERLKGHTGELLLFTFTVKTLHTSRRGGPGTGQSWDDYRDTWGVACGVFKDNKLRIEEAAIVLPIDAYAISRYGWNAQLEFRLDKNPLTSRYLSSHRLDEYAEATGEKYADGDLKTQIHIGDKQVQDWFDREKQTEEFRKCCDLLNKLVLEPTEE